MVTITEKYLEGISRKFIESAERKKSRIQSTGCLPFSDHIWWRIHLLRQDTKSLVNTICMAVLVWPDFSTCPLEKEELDQAMAKIRQDYQVNWKSETLIGIFTKK